MARRARRTNWARRRKGIREIRLGLDSLFFGCLFTHEQRIARLTVAQWEKALADIDRATSRWDPIFKSYDTIAAYAKSRYDTKVTEASCDPRIGRIRIRVAGESPLPLSLYVFAKGDLEYRFQEIPALRAQEALMLRRKPQAVPITREAPVAESVPNPTSVWWSSEIRSLLWLVLCPADPTYMGYQNSVDHHTMAQCEFEITSSFGTGIHGVLVPGTNPIHRDLRKGLALAVHGDSERASWFPVQSQHQWPGDDSGNSRILVAAFGNHLDCFVGVASNDFHDLHSEVDGL